MYVTYEGIPSIPSTTWTILSDYNLMGWPRAAHHTGPSPPLKHGRWGVAAEAWPLGRDHMPQAVGSRETG